LRFNTRVSHEIEKQLMTGTEWQQLLGGLAALLVSVTFSYYLFVAPSRVRREAMARARRLRDPRKP
jgi:hypothetical protein